MNVKVPGECYKRGAQFAYYSFTVAIKLLIGRKRVFNKWLAPVSRDNVRQSTTHK